MSNGTINDSDVDILRQTHEFATGVDDAIEKVRNIGHTPVALCSKLGVTGYEETTERPRGSLREPLCS